MIDGEAVVIGPDGSSLFDEVAPSRQCQVRSVVRVRSDRARWRGSSRAPFCSNRKAASACLIRGIKVGILRNEHLAEEGALVFEHACKFGAEGIVSKRVDAPYRSGPPAAWIKARNPASIAVQRERSENWNK